MSPRNHLLISSVAAASAGWHLQSWTTAAACLIAGTLVDMDHYIDFWLNHGFHWRPSELLDFCNYGSSQRFLALLHAWELIPLLLWSAWLPGWYGDAATGIALGYTLHLIADQLGNRHLNPWCYFILYRAWHKFEHGRMVLYYPLPHGTRRIPQ
jgi:hypothetical protein